MPENYLHECRENLQTYAIVKSEYSPRYDGFEADLESVV